MIEIDSTRYAKVGRGTVLAILAQAQVTPDKFTAHRNRTYTARYLRDRNTKLNIGEIEAIDQRIAILKKPSEKLDTGRYVTFKFAMASPEKLGIRVESKQAKKLQVKPKKEIQNINSHVLGLVNSVARNMRELTNFAHELASTGDKHNHLILTLEELQSQAKLLQDSLDHIKDGQPK